MVWTSKGIDWAVRRWPEAVEEIETRAQNPDNDVQSNDGQHDIAPRILKGLGDSNDTENN
jgi:hypothetical protein